ncbi:glycosyl hydrolase family 28-related protein [Haloferula sp. A504]|uniref:right-handed parallel beta-helix repeat-containing protein n=1 Tax=Haloferula sp. A504 TaxID=3373601 RepID=UPI0031BDCCF6|nr:hypothetical protein [Verrucomicrobiaceae bacterium E54]
MAIFLLVSGLEARDPSSLWGEGGEAWDPAGRLPDFSFAGYHFGEKGLPEVEAVADVTDFGAVGDGVTDCTEAFRQAIAEVEEGAILVPPGRFLIRDILWIEKPGIVLRGAGPRRTILLVDTELEDVRPNMGATTSGRPTSNYSWSGGFLWVKGKIDRPRVAKIVRPAERGGRILEVGDTSGLEAGMRVVIRQQDDEGKSLLSHLYSGDSGDVSKITSPVEPEMVARIATIDGDLIELDRPLQIDVRMDWTPALHGFEPSVEEVGIEDLAIEFPSKPYAGHFTERGMNGIAMNGVANCWVRNVRISNSDSGVYLSGVNCSMKGVLLDSVREPEKGCTGHHGITVGRDCLVENFIFKTRFIHDITVTSLGSGNVIKNGRGPDLSFDHHKRAPHDNLFCRIDVGEGKSVWRCGGGAALGRHSGARTTFWAIESKRPIAWPPDGFGPDSMNLVGVRGKGPGVTDIDGRWHEMIEPSLLVPSDLHAAQLKRRMADRIPVTTGSIE